MDITEKIVGIIKNQLGIIALFLTFISHIWLLNIMRNYIAQKTLIIKMAFL